MKRMRTLPKAVAEIKEIDPGACISVHALRHWVKQGLLPVVYKGSHALIDLGDLEAFLAGENV